MRTFLSANAGSNLKGMRWKNPENEQPEPQRTPLGEEIRLVFLWGSSIPFKFRALKFSTSVDFSRPKTPKVNDPVCRLEPLPARPGAIWRILSRKIQYWNLENTHLKYFFQGLEFFSRGYIVGRETLNVFPGVVFFFQGLPVLKLLWIFFSSVRFFGSMLMTFSRG